MQSLFTTCAWCKKEVPEDYEPYQLNAATKYKNLLEGHEGQFIQLPLTLANKTVHAFVVTNDSEAKNDGWDLVLMACSSGCGKSLKVALEQEGNISNVFH